MKKGKKSNQKRFSALSVFLCIKIALKHVIKKQRNPTNKSTRKLSNKKCEYAWNQYRKLFIENELNKEKNRKCRYAHNLYDNFSKEKKDKRREYPREKYRKLSEEEKDRKRQYARQRNMNLLEGLNSCGSKKIYFRLESSVFSGHHKRVFQELGK